MPEQATQITSDHDPIPTDPAVTELVAIMQTARRRWSRDDYGTETQDEFVAAAILAAGYTRALAPEGAPDAAS